MEADSREFNSLYQPSSPAGLWHRWSISPSSLAAGLLLYACYVSPD